MRAFALVFAVIACNSTATVAPPSPSTTSTTSLFTYVEDGDELTFTPPTEIHLVRSADGGKRTCTSNLSTGKDNMWTGPDVESAFRNADVQAALRGGTISYFPEIDDAAVITEGTLRTSKGTIEWKPRPCHWCVAPAPGVVHLRKVLMTVMMNRRLLCP